jgi:hypothetical protein
MTNKAERWGSNRLIPTLSGRWIDPFDLSPADMAIEDIAITLAHQCRYGGACNWHYSVAQHAWHLSYLVPESLAFAALNHDTVETWLPDQLAPLKRDDGMAAWRAAEAQGHDAVADRLNLPRGFHDGEEIERWHKRLTATEFLQLKGLRIPDGEPLDMRVPRMLPTQAAGRFMDRFFELWRR